MIQKEKLFQLAKDIRDNSHSPYSGYKVASAIQTQDDRIFGGVNVENASYGGTICAERSAIFSAVSAGSKKIKAVLVLTDEQNPWPPCGLCRQVIAEFAGPEVPIYLANLKGIQKETTFGHLFPNGFSGEHLS